MYFPVTKAEVLYIIVYIKIHIGNYMYKVHYVCDILEYNTVTWCIYDDDTITKYSVYPMNVYDNLSIDKKPKKWKEVIMGGSDRIVSMLYIKKYILALSTYYFITGRSVSKVIENIKERIADFRYFKEKNDM